MKKLFLFSIVLFLLNSTSFAAEQSVVRIGILAFRPAADVRQQWQPLVDYLTEKIPGYQFRIDAYGYQELETFIARRDIDFVLTNPGHYVLMTYRNRLSSPLATLIPYKHDQALSRFGGVIITRKDQENIHSLESLKHHTVAAVTKGSLGGYQAQAMELLSAGLVISKDIRLLETGMPHDNVVQAALEGKAEAGFVRTGILEDMAREGKLDLAQIKIIAPKKVDHFPLILSTRLYPEWPFSAMPGVDEDLARKIAAALLSLPHSLEVAHALQIHGFTIPTDYELVRETLEKLRLPPFDKVPDFTVNDIYGKYQLQIIGGLIFTVLAVALLTWLFYLNKQLLARRREVEQASEERNRLLTALGEGVYGADSSGRCTFVNPAALAMLGFDEDELIGKDQHALFHHHKEDGRLYPASECPIALTINDGVARIWKDWFWRKDGTGFPVSLTTAPMGSHGTVVVFRDISAQRKLEEQLLREASSDPLTGIANRRLFMKELEKELNRFRRFGEQTAVIMVDIDHFKKVNDRHGHAIGDEVLKQFTQLVQKGLRTTDLLGRLGGEEFGIILPVTDKLEAKIFAERLRRMVENTPAVTSDAEVPYTISMGIAEFVSDDAMPDTVLSRADKALYQAKETGRNRVEVAFSAGNRSIESSFVHLHWRQTYFCGQPTIDSEHHKLFEMANTLLDLSMRPKEAMHEIKDAFDDLLQHVAKHFQDEEKILRSAGYDRLEEHARLHRALVTEATRLRGKLEREEVQLKEIVDFLVIDVVAIHMLQEDIKFFPLFQNDPE